jgi:membrane fusion protein, heavy metal efflux system
VITDKTAASLLAIPAAAIVDANGKKVVYVQNGNAFQAAEVTFGRTSGDMVEVKTGLFAGDMVVTQRGTQLYAQSLRGGGEKPAADEHQDEAAPAKSNGLVIPPWLLPVGGGAILVTGGALLLRKRFRSASVDGLDDGEEDAYAHNHDLALPVAELTEPEPYTNNHQSVPLSPVIMGEKSGKGE